jgi:hypothetical protein
MAITAHTFEVPGGKPCTIFAETDNINYFLNNPLEADIISGPENRQATVKTHTRRQYPGDVTKINVSATTKTFLVDPSRTSGRALPGRPFKLREVGGNKEFRSFTVRGRVIDLHAFLRAEAAFQMKFYTADGAKHTIPAATAA